MDWNSLYPADRTPAIGDMTAYKPQLSESMRARYETAADYMKMGRWMMFEVRARQDLDDYKLIMSAKMAPKK